MADINKVVVCLEKIKNKNMGQNPDNLIHFLMKDYGFDNEDAKNLIDEALAANMIKSVTFNKKVAYRIVSTDTTADGIADDTIFVPETQEPICNGTVSNATVVVEETLSLPEQQSNNHDNVLNVLESFRSSLEAIDNRFLKIEDRLIGLSSSSHTNSNSGETATVDNFYVELLKKRISELERQLTEKNAIIDFLTAQFISKPPDTSTDSDNNCRQRNNNDNNRFKNNDVPCENFDNEKEVVIVGDSMLNNIKGRGLSKSQKVEVLNFPGATSSDIVEKIDDILENRPKSLIVHVGTNDLTNDVNLLNNVKKIVSKTKKKSPSTALSFSNIIVRKDQRNLEKKRSDTNGRLKNFCSQKNIGLLNNDNLKETHLGIKKLHLNRKGNTVFAKNLLNFIEGH